MYIHAYVYLCIYIHTDIHLLLPASINTHASKAAAASCTKLRVRSSLTAC